MLEIKRELIVIARKQRKYIGGVRKRNVIKSTVEAQTIERFCFDLIKRIEGNKEALKEYTKDKTEKQGVKWKL